MKSWIRIPIRTNVKSRIRIRHQSDAKSETKHLVLIGTLTIRPGLGIRMVFITTAGTAALEKMTRNSNWYRYRYLRTYVTGVADPDPSDPEHFDQVGFGSG
jgi:hypothetical protein